MPEARDSARFWLVLAAVLGAAAWSNQWEVDNHQFLIAYWCLTIGVTVGSPDRDRAQRLAARLSPDFVDESFMHHTLLTDGRFAEVATVAGGLRADDLDANRQAMASLDVPTRPVGPVQLRSTPHLELAARVLTWWTLAIEGTVAAAFLVPWRRLARYRDLVLVASC